MLTISQPAGISFPCGSQPRAHPSSLRTPDIAICWTLTLTKSPAAVKTVSLVAWWVFSLMMSPLLLSHLSKLCHNSNEPQLRGECFQQGIQSGYWTGLLKIHFYGIGLILVPCTPVQRSLNAVADGFGSRNAFTYYASIRVKILINSNSNRELNL